MNLASRWLRRHDQIAQDFLEIKITVPEGSTLSFVIVATHRHTHEAQTSKGGAYRVIFFHEGVKFGLLSLELL